MKKFLLLLSVFFSLAATAQKTTSLNVNRLKVVDSFYLGGRWYQSIPTGGGGGGIALTDLGSTAPIVYNSGTGRFSITQAGTSTNGYLSSSNFNIFNNKQAAVSLTTTGTSGAATFAGNVFNIPVYTLAGLGGISLSNLSASGPLAYNNTTGAFSISQATTSTNGYLTATNWNTFNSKQAAVSLTTTGTSGAATFSGTVFNIPNYTLAGLGGISLSNLSASGPLAYNNTTGAFSISQANTSTAGYLSALDWNTFNSKQAAVSLTTTGTSGAATFAGNVFNIPVYTLAGLGGISLSNLSASGPLSYNNTTGAFSISQANTSTPGYLSAADWNTFNSKQAPVSLTTTGTSGAATFTGNVLNIPQYAALNDIVVKYPLYVISKDSTGALNDSLKVDTTAAGLGALVTQYQVGKYLKNITSVNDSTIAFTKGDGTVTNLVFHGSTLTPTNLANGYLNRYNQYVAFNTDSITQGTTNKWYTDALARASISVTGSGGSYNSTTGVITLTGGGGGSQWTTGTFNTTNIFFGAIGNIGNVGIGDTARSKLTITTNNGLGTTYPGAPYLALPDSLGVIIQNLTPATNGTQQAPGFITYIGQGYKTNVTAGSQTIEVRTGLVPIQGTAAAGGDYVIEFKLPGSSSFSAQQFRFDHLGNFFALTGISTNGGISAGGSVGGTSFAMNAASTNVIPNITTTSTAGLTFSGSLATVGVTVRRSQYVAQSSSAWNTTTVGASLVTIADEVRAVSGATVTGSKVWMSKIDGGAFIDALELFADGRLSLKNTLNLKTYTVATLPAGNVNDIASVSDAVSPSYLGTLTGGGNVKTPVFFNGTAWVSY